MNNLTVDFPDPPEYNFPENSNVLRKFLDFIKLGPKLKKFILGELRKDLFIKSQKEVERWLLRGIRDRLGEI